jgi:thioredoxin reductase (NADPH)
MEIERVTIIGAGPAGLATALQLKRYGIDPLLLERGEIGGLLKNANQVENYPGFPGGLPGTELVALFELQARAGGVSVTNGEVVELAFGDGIFLVKTEDRQYRSQVVVIASGTRSIAFSDFSIPAQLMDKVFYEVHPLLEIEGKRMVIVGAGDASFDYALNLSRTNDVLILNRGKEAKCLPLLWQRASVAPRITYRPKTRIVKMLDGPQDGFILECVNSNGTEHISADYLIGAIGRRAELDFLSSELVEQLGELKQKGILYLAGDVKNDIYRQTSIAVGDGIMAAMKIYRRFEEISE